MPKLPILSKKTRTIYRLIGITGCILLSISFILFILGKRNIASSTFDYFFSIAFYICIISCFVLIIIKPECLEFLAFASFIYSFLMISNNPANVLAVPMTFIGIATLALRGFFDKKKGLKITLLAIIYLALIVSNLRFGFQSFFDSFLDLLAGFLLLSVLFIFVQRYFKIKAHQTFFPYFNLTEYTELTEQDKAIIKLLNDGEKYDWIAGNLKIATPTLKKKVRRIFDILGVADLISFHTAIGGRKIIYTEEELEVWKKENKL
jgi:hypothetical protein